MNIPRMENSENSKKFLNILRLENSPIESYWGVPYLAFFISFFRRGLLYYEQNRYAEAEQHYVKAILYRPHMALANLNMGVLLAAQGRHGEAKAVSLIFAFSKREKMWK